MMTIDEYYMVLRKSRDYKDKYEDTTESVLGLMGECGEVADLYKKQIRDGKLDNIELALELGDVLYYLVVLIKHEGLSVEGVLDMNIDKLIERGYISKEDVKEVLDGINPDI